MADEQKPSRWKSLPGVLTAATGFVAALSGLVAGLNQLGVFRREPPAAQAVSAAPAPRGSTHRDSAAAVIAESASTNSHSRTPAPARPTTAPPPTPPITTAKDTAVADTAAVELAAAAQGHGARSDGAVAQLRAVHRAEALHGAAGRAGQGRRRHDVARGDDGRTAPAARRIVRAASGATRLAGPEGRSALRTDVGGAAPARRRERSVSAGRRADHGHAGCSGPASAAVTEREEYHHPTHPRHLRQRALSARSRYRAGPIHSDSLHRYAHAHPHGRLDPRAPLGGALPLRPGHPRHHRRDAARRDRRATRRRRRRPDPRRPHRHAPGLARPARFRPAPRGPMLGARGSSPG